MKTIVSFCIAPDLESRLANHLTASLPAGTMVWLTSSEAEFLKGKYIWANWDIEEMKARAEEIGGSDLLTMKLGGWPFAQESS
jgi:hypothetical protein